MDAGTPDSGPGDAGNEGGAEGGIVDAGPTDSGADSGVIMMPMCGQNCAYTCRTQAQCTQLNGIVCN
jgi:hypothetical protein